MTEAEWSGCADLPRMLRYLEPRASGRKFRLFACACCRQWRELVGNVAARIAVEAAESFAEGRMTETDFHSMWETEREHPVVDELYEADGPTCAFRVMEELNFLYTPKAVERVIPLLHDIFGNPFRPAPVLPDEALAWNDRTIRHLAFAASADTGSLNGRLKTERLKVMSDALEAGVCDPTILAHLREQKRHAYGCWVLDLILGKN